ncbi:MAG: DUF4359 domain-containing protein [Cyanobacteriota bacterium]|nr:DUF4359 domain-containing protein [Cyanobacteriota bacterium]
MAPSWAPCALLAAAAGVFGLVLTNPGPEDFQDFAGRRLADTLTQEVCQGSSLPLAIRLLLQRCPELVASQQQVLGRLALDHSRRTNFGVASLYRTQLGGQQLLPNLQLPRYEAVTLAGAGQFHVINIQTGQRP